MGYKPKIIKGIVKGTSWPIDGRTLHFSQWDYDNYDRWHLFGWDEADDDAVMETMFLTEEKAGICCYNTLEDFAKDWNAKKWEPQGAFCLELDQVEVIEVVQQEVKNDTCDQLRAKGFDLTPRKYIDKGGILCLPLDKNINGDVQAKHPDWVPIDFPNCGRKCWKMPEANKLKEAQGVELLCTECAVKAGFLSLYQTNKPNPAGNRPKEGGQDVKGRNNTSRIFDRAWAVIAALTALLLLFCKMSGRLAWSWPSVALGYVGIMCSLMLCCVLLANAVILTCKLHRWNRTPARGEPDPERLQAAGPWRGAGQSGQLVQPDLEIRRNRQGSAQSNPKNH